jgi:hypothetical protein
MLLLHMLILPECAQLCLGIDWLRQQYWEGISSTRVSKYSRRTIYILNTHQEGIIPYILPPRSVPLIAIMIAPTHTITNTISKSRVLSCESVAVLRILQCWSIKGRLVTLQAWGRTKLVPKDPLHELYQMRLFTVSDFLLSRLWLHRLDWVDDNEELRPYSTQVSFL